MYRRYIKRLLDFFLALIAILLLSPVFIVLTIVGAVSMKGNPFFVQPRPGKDEKIFKLLKYRSMTSKTDENGELLPDNERLTAYGRFIRATSLDELPELLNILAGSMSFVGPRPQLVRDMVFMTPKQRTRHSVRPGLTGLAQVSGRNALRWDHKLEIDLQYISNISFLADIKIIFKTAKIIVCGGESDGEVDLTDDLGDFLLKQGQIDAQEYQEKQQEAKVLLKV